MIRCRDLVPVFTALILPPLAYAQAPAGAPVGPPPLAPTATYPAAPNAMASVPRAGFHEHDGVFVRLVLGGGYNNMSTSVQGSDIKVSGGGGSFAVAVGGALSRNLVLYGEIAESTA